MNTVKNYKKGSVIEYNREEDTSYKPKGSRARYEKDEPIKKKRKKNGLLPYVDSKPKTESSEGTGDQVLAMEAIDAIGKSMYGQGLAREKEMTDGIYRVDVMGNYSYKPKGSNTFLKVSRDSAKKAINEKVFGNEGNVVEYKDATQKPIKKVTQKPVVIPLRDYSKPFSRYDPSDPRQIRINERRRKDNLMREDSAKRLARDIELRKATQKERNRQLKIDTKHRRSPITATKG